MDTAIEVYAETLRSQKGTGFFFYAGHGIQSKGQNYLLPVNTNLSSESELKYRTVNLAFVLDEIEASGNHLNVVVIDACRNNPLTRSFRSSSRGLARVSSTPKDLLLAYSTAPGDVAADGNGRNSPYTSALINAIEKPGQHLLLAFQQVASSVQKTTGGNQIPWTSSSVTSDFYFSNSTGARAQHKSYPEQLLTTTNTPSQLSAVKGKPSAKDTQVAEPSIPIRTGNQTKASFGTWEVIQDPLTSVDAKAPSMVVVSGGDFMMGSEGENATEEPLHQVSLDSEYAIGQFELSVADYQLYINATGVRNRHRHSDPNLPLSNVSRAELDQYAKWLSQETGYTYRLPTEAEWEFAARGGTSSKYHWGEDIWTCAGISATDIDRLRHINSPKLQHCAKALSLEIQANCKHCLAWVKQDQVLPVNSFNPNPFGLFNSLGNIAEIVMDCWKPNYYGAPTDGSARLSGKCDKITVRSGHWNSEFANITSSARSALNKTGKSKYVGARLVRELY